MDDERARFEKWCPIVIVDPETAPRAAALKQAYWTSWQACAESVAPMREALQDSITVLLAAQSRIHEDTGHDGALAACRKSDCMVVKGVVARAAEVLKGDEDK